MNIQCFKMKKWKMKISSSLKKKRKEMFIKMKWSNRDIWQTNKYPNTHKTWVRSIYKSKAKQISHRYSSTTLCFLPICIQQSNKQYVQLFEVPLHVLMEYLRMHCSLLRSNSACVCNVCVGFNNHYILYWRPDTHIALTREKNYDIQHFMTHSMKYSIIRRLDS